MNPRIHLVYHFPPRYTIGCLHEALKRGCPKINLFPVGFTNTGQKQWLLALPGCSTQTGLSTKWGWKMVEFSTASYSAPSEDYLTMLNCLGIYANRRYKQVPSTENYLTLGLLRFVTVMASKSSSGVQVLTGYT